MMSSSTHPESGPATVSMTSFTKDMTEDFLFVDKKSHMNTL